MILNKSTLTITEEFAEKVKRDNTQERVMRIAPMLVLALLILIFTVTCGGSFV